MAPQIYVFVQPSAHSAARRCGAKLCLSGWRAEEDCLLCPQKRNHCGLLCVETLSASPGLEQALLRECRECSADGVFLDADSPSRGLSEIADALCRSGIRVFSPVRTCRDAVLVSREKGSAILIEPRCQKTLLSRGGRAQKQSLTLSEVGELIDSHTPSVFRSAELGSKYFSVRGSRETLFVVYDTPETLWDRISAASAETVFLHWSTVMDYFQGRLPVAEK